MSDEAGVAGEFRRLYSYTRSIAVAGVESIKTPRLTAIALFATFDFRTGARFLPRRSPVETFFAIGGRIRLVPRR